VGESSVVIVSAVVSSSEVSVAALVDKTTEAVVAIVDTALVVAVSSSVFAAELISETVELVSTETLPVHGQIP
jgi:hypothetical protein